MRLTSIAVLLSFTPALIAAAQPIRLQPSSPWVVDYAENSCRLVRTFGTGDGKVIFGLESESPEQVDMLVVGGPLASYSDEVPARFLPFQNKPMEGEPENSDRGPGVLWAHVRLLPDDLSDRLEQKGKVSSRPGVRPPPLDLAEEAQIKAERLKFASAATELEIDARRNRPVILETGSLGGPIKAFDKCSRDSLRDWGVDPDLEDRIVRRPWSPNVAKWFSPDDYPPNMVANGEESDVKVRLLVDASGNVTKCTSLSHFREPAFNKVVCDKFMKRAHFQPAELADGTKVPSFYTNHIRFRIAY
jgi:hypothetical protein